MSEQLYRRVAIKDGETDEPVQFVAVHLLKWRSEYGDPTAAFVEVAESDGVWGEIEAQAKSCQKTWGMGFPVISLAILKPMWDRLHE